MSGFRRPALEANVHPAVTFRLGPYLIRVHPLLSWNPGSLSIAFSFGDGLLDRLGLFRTNLASLC
jgi:hypothetical protein